MDEFLGYLNPPNSFSDFLLIAGESKALHWVSHIQRKMKSRKVLLLASDLDSLLEQNQFHSHLHLLAHLASFLERALNLFQVMQEA